MDYKDTAWKNLEKQESIDYINSVLNLNSRFTEIRRFLDAGIGFRKVNKKIETFDLVSGNKIK